MTNEQDSVVPDSLLAFAKDHRYIRQCQVLLQQVFFSQSTEKNTWWWSALLYATLVVGRKGRTLGMEFMGLQHHEPTFQKRAAQVLLAAGWAFWIRQYMKRGGVVEEQQRQHERLRGAARQYFYEQQRRAMMQRASPLQASSTSSSSQPLNATQIPNGTPSSDWTGRIRKSFQRLIQIMSEAMSSSCDNPHSLPDTTAALSISRWIMRLHLGHYCITGRFPTLWHRLLNMSSVERKSDTRIADPPPASHVLVGRLILIQVGAILTQTLGRWFASHVASKRTQTEVLQGSGGTIEVQDTAAATASDSQHCGICRMPRSHSAAPTACGHVFCWKCLCQWTSTVRPECPLCRSACRPQDILALHNY